MDTVGICVVPPLSPVFRLRGIAAMNIARTRRVATTGLFPQLALAAALAGSLEPRPTVTP